MKLWASMGSFSSGTIDGSMLSLMSMYSLHYFGSFQCSCRSSLLCTRRPKFEDLSLYEQGLYQDDKDLYLQSASVNEGKTLYFARSGSRTETWVPLIEKAYAKLHGHYAYLHLGKTCEALEDLTGGVSKNIFINVCFPSNVATQLI